MKSIRALVLAVIAIIAAVDLWSVDLSCTASKVAELKGRLADAPISQKEKEDLARKGETIFNELMPLFAQAGDVEARQRRAFDSEKERIVAADQTLQGSDDADPRLQHQLWRSDTIRALAAESLDIQEKLNREEEIQKRLIATIPSAEYADNVEAAAKQVAQRAGLALDSATDHLAYSELLTTYALAKDLPTGSDDNSIALASRQAKDVFDTPVVNAVDAGREVLRTMQAADLRVDLGLGHLWMNAPPPADRKEIMRTNNELSRSISRHEGELSQVRLQNYVARKVLRQIEVPSPQTTASDTATATTGRMDALADQLKKKSDLVVEYILVGRKKAAP